MILITIFYFKLLFIIGKYRVVIEKSNNLLVKLFRFYLSILIILFEVFLFLNIRF